MRAAVVRELGRSPEYAEVPEPSAGPHETVVAPVAAALSPLAVSRASGTHYSTRPVVPFVVGVDAVATTPDGRRVYGAFPRPPRGTFAERVVLSPEYLVDLPADLDPVTAAAAAIPGMSCWIPLRSLAPVRPGEAVLVNGATGISGQMAVQVAKHLGAERVVATGRDEKRLGTLRTLGADVLLPLGLPPDEFRASVRREARESRIGVVLDYLWGPSAQLLLESLGGPDAPRGGQRIRYVQVGSIAGPTIPVAGSWLRSSGVELLGTGLGGTENTELIRGIGEFLHAFRPAGFRVPTEAAPLATVGDRWGDVGAARRLVFTIP